MATLTKAESKEIQETLSELGDWLNQPKVRWLICDGGRGNLGEQAAYHQIQKRKKKALQLLAKLYPE